MTSWSKWFNRTEDWEKIREQLLKDRLTNEWFEKETVEKLFDVKINLGFFGHGNTSVVLTRLS